ncbi:MAG: FkbM family methyltransferase [Hyphomicrobium sp.]|jgi:FkbM family methyltransferase
MISTVAVACLRLLPVGAARKIARSMPIRHDVEVDGIKLRCHPSDNVTERELMLDPRTGNESVGSLDWVVEGLGTGGTFVDIGANCGLYSLFAARAVGPTGRVIAIEPIPLMQERLRFNARRNGFDGIELVPSAVGPQAGTATLYVRGKNYGQSSLIAEPGFAPLTVPVAPLTDILAAKDIASIDVLKIDVEGFEDRVIIPFLRDSARSLWPRRIVIEIASASDWHEDCAAFFVANGYRLMAEGFGDALFEL